MADFDIAYKKTNVNEGGWSQVDGDTGLETYCGVSRKWHPHWEGWRIVDAHKPLKRGQIIHDSVLESMKHAFYKQEYWDKIEGDQMQSQELADEVYDMAVVSGVPTALKLLRS